MEMKDWKERNKLSKELDVLRPRPRQFRSRMEMILQYDFGQVSLAVMAAAQRAKDES
jgi:hypothetical protein